LPRQIYILDRFSRQVYSTALLTSNDYEMELLGSNNSVEKSEKKWMQHERWDQQEDECQNNTTNPVSKGAPLQRDTTAPYFL